MGPVVIIAVAIFRDWVGRSDTSTYCAAMEFFSEEASLTIL